MENDNAPDVIVPGPIFDALMAVVLAQPAGQVIDLIDAVRQNVRQDLPGVKAVPREDAEAS